MAGADEGARRSTLFLPDIFSKMSEIKHEEPLQEQSVKTWRMLLWLLVLAAATAAVYAFYLSTLTSTAPNWPAPANSKVQPLATKAGLLLLPKEGVEEHIHAHVSITFNGEVVAVPANLGINTKELLYSEIHTHEVDGILHVESSMPRPFYLRQAFIEWNVPLHARGVGQYLDGRYGVKVKAFVNQKPYAGDLRKLELKNKQDISIAITTDGSKPASAPKFKWPKGY